MQPEEHTLPLGAPDGWTEAAEFAEQCGSRLFYVTDQPLVGNEGEPLAIVEQGKLTVISTVALGYTRIPQKLAAIFEGNGTELSAVPQPRLLAGMIRSNQPGRLALVLMSAFIAILATGGFGVFYGSIWTMAAELTPVRLSVISVLGVAAVTVSLVVGNGLWEHSHEREPRWLGRLDNLSTLITVGISTALIFVASVLALWLLGLVVVPPGYLREQVGSTPYFRIGWFAACLGTLGGAVASNFDRSPRIRSATYNPRENARRD
ncbi:hypothetical protein [Corynebacterium tapiri]|uniref:Uncharacterized protein n=1 Tax=Corynebacterium tapiri TaxID=1448266 RepID=A0A5C4U345_9CORY|nr:hypothetical protein [Corynebacterium tapiri]TNL97327.1 hypothetical protein FHE74_06545 [Corynebacterium tapiri]